MPSNKNLKTTRSRKSTGVVKTTDAVKILRRVTGGDRELEGMIAEEKLNIRVARLIYQARMKAGLTQAQLAGLLGTQQPSIARLEDAEYGGHSLSMLDRIGQVLHRRLEVRFEPAPRK